MNWGHGVWVGPAVGLALGLGVGVGEGGAPGQIEISSTKGPGGAGVAPAPPLLPLPQLSRRAAETNANSGIRNRQLCQAFIKRSAMTSLDVSVKDAVVTRTEKRGGRLESWQKLSNARSKKLPPISRSGARLGGRSTEPDFSAGGVTALFS